MMQDCVEEQTQELMPFSKNSQEEKALIAHTLFVLEKKKNLKGETEMTKKEFHAWIMTRWKSHCHANKAWQEDSVKREENKKWVFKATQSKE